jgi:hypothetical protein
LWLSISYYRGFVVILLQLCTAKSQKWHFGHGFVKEERVKHAGHALVAQRALETDFAANLDQIVSKSCAYQSLATKNFFSEFS